MPNATRRVAVKIALTGYEEYRATVTRLNNANKLFASELGVVDKKLQANSTDMASLKRQHDILKDAFDTQRAKLQLIKDALTKAKDEQEQYSRKVEEARQKLIAATEAHEKYKLDTGNSTDTTSKFAKAVDDAQRELDEAIGYLNAADRGVADMQKSYNNAEQQLYKYEGALVQNQIAQEKANGTYKEGYARVGELGTVYKDTTEAADNWTKQMSTAVDTIAKSEAFGIIKESVDAIKDALMDCINTSIDFESAFAGVAKTWHGSDEELAKFSDTIKQMALRLPVTTEEISKVAESAGQLGIETKDLEKFTETMLGLGNATNITSDEAAILAAQFRAVNDFGTENIDRFASSVVWLGNNSATTEKDIMAMAQRLASAGSQAGLSAQDILGVATALSSTGIAAEAGGGSFSKFIANLQVGVETGKVGKIELGEFAKVAGMTAKQFKEQWSKDPVIAIQKFVDGLAAAGDEGKSSIKVLQELGIKEIRMRNALLSLASGENKLTKYVEGSNEAWEKNVALQDEVEKRYDTTESQTKLLNNNIDAMKREVGDALIPVIRDAIDAVIPIIQNITEFIKQNPELIQQIAKITAAVLAATSVVATIGTVIAAISAVGSPAILVIAGLTAAISGMSNLIGESSVTWEQHTATLDKYGQKVLDLEGLEAEWNHEYNETVGSIGMARDSADEYIKTLERLESKGKLTKEEQKEYNEAVAKIKEIYPDVNIEIDKHTGKIKGGTEALKDQIKSWEDLMMVQLYQERMKNVMNQVIELQNELHENNKKRKNIEWELNELQKKREPLLKEEKVLRDKLIKSQETGEELTDAEKKRLEELTGQISDLNAEIKVQQNELDDVTYAIDEETHSIADLQKEYNHWSSSMKEVGRENEETAETISNVGTEAEETAEKVEEAGDDIVEALDLKDDLKRKAGESMDAYTKRLREAGMDEGTITKIKNFYYDKLPKDFKSQGKSAGQSYVEGIIIGLGTKNTQLKTTAQGIAKIVNGKVTQTWMEKSPSRVAMKYGAYYVEGLQMGMESEKDNLSREAEKIAKSTNNIMDHSLDSSLIFGNQGSLNLDTSGRQTVQIKQDDSTQKDLTTMVGLMERYLPAFANMQVVMNSGELVGSIAPKIDEYFANEQLAHERGM